MNVNTTTLSKPLEKEIEANGVKYYFRYKLEIEDDEREDSEKYLNNPLDFLPILFEAMDEPLSKFIECSNLVFSFLYPNARFPSPPFPYQNNINLPIKKVNKITIIFRSMDGVAYTAGDEINMSIDYFYEYYQNALKDVCREIGIEANLNENGNNNENTRKLINTNSTATVTKTVLTNPESKAVSTVITTTVIKTILEDTAIKPHLDKAHKEAINRLCYEISGVMVHELVHVWQFCCDNIAPNLIEGVADAVRLVGGYPARHWVEDIVEIDDEHKDSSWKRGHQFNGYFLGWVQKNIKLVDEYYNKGETFISALNRGVQKSYSESLFEKITGYSLKDLYLFYGINVKNE